MDDYLAILEDAHRRKKPVKVDRQKTIKHGAKLGRSSRGQQITLTQSFKDQLEARIQTYSERYRRGDEVTDGVHIEWE